MVERLRRVLRLDDRVRLRQPLLVVAALVAARLLEQRAARDGLVGVEQRFQLLPLDLDQLERRTRLGERLRRDAGDGAAFEVRLLVDPRYLAGADDGEHAGCGRGGTEVDPAHACPRVRAAQDRALEHPGSLMSPV